MESGRQKLNLRSKSIWKIGKTNIAVMADKVELNVDENQAICPSKIDFMQKYPSETHIKKRLKACSSFVTGCPELCNYNMETKCSFFNAPNTFGAPRPCQHPLIFLAWHIAIQCLYFLVSHIFCAFFLCAFCCALFFAMHLHFPLIWLLYCCGRSSKHPPTPFPASLCVRVFCAPFGFPPIAFPLSHRQCVSVCVKARGYWWVGCATHFLTFRWGKCVFMHWLAAEWAPLGMGSAWFWYLAKFPTHGSPSMSLFPLVGVHFSRACHLMWLWLCGHIINCR